MLFEFLQWDDYAIVFSNSLNAQNDCPDVFFKLGENWTLMTILKRYTSG